MSSPVYLCQYDSFSSRMDALRAVKETKVNEMTKVTSLYYRVPHYINRLKISISSISFS